MSARLTEAERRALAVALHRSSISRRDLVEALLLALDDARLRELFKTFVRR